MIEPSYFPAGDRSLFGCAQAPLTTASGLGVLLCYPIGDEYIRFHRACRQLTIRLARAGHAVLRFDYSGTGDSSGDLEDARVDAWVDDVAAAAERLRAMPGVTRVAACGLRVGGTLAMLAGARGTAFDALCLWDAVHDGAAYVDELVRLHAAMVKQSHVIPRPDETPAGVTEIVGFPFADALLDDLRAIDAGAMQRAPAPRAALIESHADAPSAPLQERLAALGTDAALEPVPMPDFWRWVEDYDKVLVPNPVLTAIVAWAQGLAS